MSDRPEKIDTPPSSHNVVKVAEEGFGKNAAAYDESRPGYTDEIVKLILEEIVLPKEMDPKSLKYEILELGAGTGKLTELVAPKVPSGYRYMATEPSVNFLDHLKSKCLPVETACLAASNIPLPDNSVQNVVCAQCLHWFSNKESFQEIRRVLKPGGKLIAVWNMKKFEVDTWPREIYKQRFVVIKRTGGSLLNWVNSMEWKTAIEACGLFTKAKEELLPGICFESNIDDILKHLSTISFYNVLPKEKRDDYLASLRSYILSYPNVNPDKMHVPFNSLIYVCHAN